MCKCIDQFVLVPAFLCVKIRQWSLRQNMTEQCFTMHTCCLRMYRPSLYNLCLCVCMCLSVWQSTYTAEVTEGLPSWWQTVWSSKISIFSLTGCQSASLFYPTFPLCLPPSLTPHPFSMKWEGMGSCQHEQRWHYCQRELSIVAVCWTRPLLSGCHCGAGMRCENFGRFVKGEIKHGTQLIWHPYLHGISPLTNRQVSQLDQI